MYFPPPLRSLGRERSCDWDEVRLAPRPVFRSSLLPNMMLENRGELSELTYGLSRNARN